MIFSSKPPFKTLRTTEKEKKLFEPKKAKSEALKKRKKADKEIHWPGYGKHGSIEKENRKKMEGMHASGDIY